MKPRNTLIFIHNRQIKIDAVNTSHQVKPMTSRHILIVDTEVLTHTTLVHQLKGLDSINIDYTHDAESAIGNIKNKFPDLLILNNELPGKSGVELLGSLMDKGLLPPQIILFGTEQPKQIIIQKINATQITCLFGPFHHGQYIESVLNSLQYLKNFGS